MIHDGDSFVTYGYPFFDLNNGGSFKGFINITRFNTKYPFVCEKRWFYRNGEKEKVINFIDAYNLAEDYGNMGTTFFIEIDGKAINFEEPQILETECWNEKGIKIKCP